MENDGNQQKMGMEEEISSSQTQSVILEAFQQDALMEVPQYNTR